MCCVIWIGRGRLHAWFKCLAFTLSLLFLLHISEHVGKKFPWMQLIWEKDNFFSLVRCSSKVCHMVNSSSLQCCPVRQNESASSIHTCGGFTYWWFTSNYIDVYIYIFFHIGRTARGMVSSITNTSRNSVERSMAAFWVTKGIFIWSIVVAHSVTFRDEEIVKFAYFFPWVSSWRDCLQYINVSLPSRSHYLCGRHQILSS